MGFNPSTFKGPLKPVHSIHWYESIIFCNRLSEIEKLEPFYQISDEFEDPFNFEESDCYKWYISMKHTNGYRLLSESEWEYAARGENLTNRFLYSGSYDLREVGWFNENSDNQTHDVGLKKPNELGLYDMSGNVEEFCWNWFEFEREDHELDPFKDFSESLMGSARIFKGGCWATSNVSCRPAFRSRCNSSLNISFSDSELRVHWLISDFYQRINSLVKYCTPIDLRLSLYQN